MRGTVVVQFELVFVGGAAFSLCVPTLGSAGVNVKYTVVFESSLTRPNTNPALFFAIMAMA